MTNHVHLLRTPRTAEGASRVIQSLGRRYVQHVNRAYRRCGTLWASRHKWSLVDAEPYLLACCRYVELNPAVAGMVSHPGDCPWSGFSCTAWGRRDGLVNPHALYLALGQGASSRQACYRELFLSYLSNELTHEIRTALDFSMPLFNDRFRHQIEGVLGRSIGQSKRGRPPLGRVRNADD